MKTVILLLLLCLPNICLGQTLTNKEQAKADKEKAEAGEKAAREKAKADQEEAKAQKKLAKKQAEAEVKATIDERRRIIVDYYELQRFPSMFVGVGQRRLYRVGLGDFGPFTDSDGLTVYPIMLRNGYDTTYTVPAANSVVFIMSEDFAKSYNATLTQLVRKDVYMRNRVPIGDVYFELFKVVYNNQPYYIAKVDCIAILDGFSSSVRTPVGNCPLVQ